jgi:hypothetical protein
MKLREEQKMEKIIDNEYRIEYAVPVTLRQVEAAHIPLNSEFGIDDAEHNELLDDINTMRIEFGINFDNEEMEVSEIIRLTCYNATLGNPAPRWDDCMARFSHASGSKMTNENGRRTNALWQLLRSIVPGYQSMIDADRKQFDECVNEFKRDHPDQFENED